MDQHTVQPDEDALQLSRDMAVTDDVMREIITETLESARKGSIREAGRTHCPTGGGIRGPLQRFPRAINLASCPIDTGGAWHTHVTPDEITNPTNSLPDMANVLFGLLDVSIVAGTQTADVVVAPEDREAAQAAFQNAIGAEVESTEELTDAIVSGKVNPVTARSRARRALSSLVRTEGTGYSDLTREAGEITASSWAHPMGSGASEAKAGNMSGALAQMVPNGRAPTESSPQRVDLTAFEDGSGVIGEKVNNIEIGGLLISTTVGTVVGGIVDRLIFGD